ncbi:MAG: hypothetical protein Q8P35_03080 [Candidatus Yanofskybacteria bacterium]|nr:hypothetical protein [Candidatus Yanofskybacteria bacterium]
MSLLEDIRKQPRTVREIMFGLSVIATLSLVGAIWFQSFERNIYALMNPDSQIEERYAVEVDKKSPLAFLGSAIEGLRAMIGSLFGNDEPSIPPNQSDNRQTDPQTLPLSK